MQVASKRMQIEKALRSISLGILLCLFASCSSTYQSLAANDNVVSPSTLRMSMHDCFIQGCDGSILISSTSDNSAERDYIDNDIPQQAFDTIDAIKKALEESCPGVVSCADIMALATLQAVQFLGGPSWQVDLGRRDSRTSLAANGAANIPRSNLDAKFYL
ncbi:hypothetical protein GOP47_0009793 [Adiantum capillus-veneris]|uniref:Plant heme peroxidase family profile domain-containing protein n=1 Tax=Adiantum capillus-veneris TaxID=13818 RepID=A0A9D4UYF7_ADICA|nr:hypothetical protein GOP47_0009793 [Adiantum capillus-veneris]